MKDSNIYQKLVDLYAGRELSTELEEEMNEAATSDADLRLDMKAMRTVVDAVKSQPNPMFTEESSQRILMKLYARGVEIQRRTADPVHLQYQLPIQG